MSDQRRELYSRLKEVTRAYGRAMERYDQAMYRGDRTRADAAMSDMQEIERSVTIIVMPGASK